LNPGGTGWLFAGIAVASAAARAGKGNQGSWQHVDSFLERVQVLNAPTNAIRYATILGPKCVARRSMAAQYMEPGYV
jgi:hypothetical protein